MQMKDAIAKVGRVRNPGFGLPTRPRSIEVGQSIAHSPTEIETRSPPQLDEISARLVKAFRAGKTPDRSDLSKAPWCLWGATPSITQDDSILRRYLEHVETAGRNRLFRRLASVYFVAFPKGQTGFDQVADTLSRVAPRFDSPWSKAASQLQIFDPLEGPTRLAEAAFSARKAPSEIIQSFGISNVPLDAKFIEAAFLVGIESIRRNPSPDPEEHLRRVKSWGLRIDGAVAFEQHRGALVDALVQPHCDPMPPKQVRDSFISVLVSKFGDPRLHPGRWGQMRDSASVIRRWLTDQSLRQFLDVFDDSALEHQWKYRRAFWEAVYRRDIISEAWVIFDRVGADRAQLLFEKETPFARWDSGGTKQIQSGQGCLLLKVGRGIIAEWSHNGRCCIWYDAADPEAPTMHKRSYQSHEAMLRRSTRDRLSIPHQYAAGYSWQRKIADAVYEMTGVRVHEREYEVSDEL
jgi:hypothetical protein